MTHGFGVGTPVEIGGVCGVVVAYRVLDDGRQALHIATSDGEIAGVTTQIGIEDAVRVAGNTGAACALAEAVVHERPLAMPPDLATITLAAAVLRLADEVRALRQIERLRMPECQI